MLKFVFLLTIWSADDVPQVYVADHNLTGEDCVERVMNYVATNPHQAHGAPSCEPDMGQPWDELDVTGYFNESPAEQF